MRFIWSFYLSLRCHTTRCEEGRIILKRWFIWLEMSFSLTLLTRQFLTQKMYIEEDSFTQCVKRNVTTSPSRLLLTGSLEFFMGCCGIFLVGKNVRLSTTATKNIFIVSHTVCQFLWILLLYCCKMDFERLLPPASWRYEHIGAGQVLLG